MKGILKIISPIVFMGLAKISFAADVNDRSSKIIQDILGVFGIAKTKLFLWALGAGAVIAFGVIVYGGVMYSLSMGGEKKNEAKEWIMGAIYGLLLLASAWLILRTINPALVSF